MTNLAHFTELGLLVPRLAGDHREAVIAELCRRLEGSGRIENSAAFGEAVMAHEDLAPAVFDGVAFPLAHQGACRELSFALGLASQPIHWGSPHGPLVQAVVLFAVPAAEQKRHSGVVLAFAGWLRDGSRIASLRACAGPEAMLAMLAQVRCQ